MITNLPIVGELNRDNAIAGGISVCILLIIYSLNIFFKTRSKPSDMPKVENELQGFGGFLIIPIIAFIIALYSGLSQLISIINGFNNQNNIVQNSTYTLVVSIISNILIIMSITLIFLKMRIAPRIIIITIVVNILMAWMYSSYCMGVREFFDNNKERIAIDIIRGFLWIAYFSRSRRVKATFIN